MALLLAQARNIPQAHAALKAGKWERSKWEGVELHGKTLGVIGLGKIGALVAQRALAFGMRLVAYDPYISEERARHMGVELVDLDTLLTESDFITIHLPKNKDTTNLLNATSLREDQARRAHHQRGAWRHRRTRPTSPRRSAAGHVQGAAIDVFEKEPTTESPLFDLPSVVVVPHLGASTVEAQDRAGRHHRRAGRARSGGRLRALRGQRLSGRGLQFGQPLHGARRGARPVHRGTPRRQAGRPRGHLPG